MDGEATSVRISGDEILTLCAAVLFLVLVVKWVWYGFDMASFLALACIVGAAVAICNVKRKRHVDVSRLRWTLSAYASILISLFGIVSFVQGFGGVRILGERTSLSHPFMVAIPFLTPSQTVKYGFLSDNLYVDGAELSGSVSSVSLPLAHGEAFFKVLVQGMSLDTRNPNLEGMLLARTQDSGTVQADLRKEVKRIISGVAQAELAKYSLSYWDANPHGLALSDQVALGIIRSRLKAIGVRWQDGRIIVTPPDIRYSN